MTRFPLSTRKALLLSFSVSIVGIWLSIDNHDWSWFSRSGSLIVVFGILLTSTQIIENSRRLSARRRRHDTNFGRDYADELKQDSLKHSRHHDEDSWESGLRGLYLLIAGTIIWGFGDLLGVLFSQ